MFADVQVWNVTPRAIGVVVNKLVGHRIMAKKIHVLMWLRFSLVSEGQRKRDVNCPRDAQSDNASAAGVRG